MYIAGFWDADGSFSVSPNTHHRPYGARTYQSFQRSVHASNTHYGVLAWIMEQFGVGSITQVRVAHDNLRTAWKLHFSANDSRDVARLLAPYLIIKKQQAEIIAAWTNKKAGGHSRDEETHRLQAGLYEQVKHLNRKGPRADHLPG